jgi:DNA-binding NtrC family response regulator
MADPDAPPPQVLIVDDEDPVRMVANRMVKRLGHASEAVSSTGAAREAVAANSDSLKLVFLDLRLGTESGLELAQEFHGQYPDLKIIGMGGDIGPEARSAMEAGVLVGLLPKPFSLGDLQKSLAAGLGQQPAS